MRSAQPRRTSQSPRSLAAGQPNRRETLRRALGLFALSVASAARLPVAIASASAANESTPRLTRVKSILEVRGEVHLKSTKETDGGVRRAPVESKTTLQYEEVFCEVDGDLQAALYFQEAIGTNTVEKHATDNSLRESSRAMIRWCDAGQNTSSYAGIDAPLTEPERQLASSPIVTMAIDCLIPPAPLAVGESFTLAADRAARLLNMDAVTAGELKASVVERADGQTHLELKGELSAAARGVPTRLRIDGKARVNDAAKMVSYLAVSLEESREIGIAEPGFEVTARYRMIREELDAPQSLGSFDSYAEAFRQREDRLQLVESDEGGYRFLTQDDWVLYKDNAVDAMLRLVRGNRMVAQCNLVNLADMEPGRQLSIEGFKSDIRRSLGASMGSLLEESERKTEQSLRLMRVVVAGRVEGVDLHWINLLISNDEGRHVSISYTVNASNLEEFGAADVQLADTFEFTRRLKTAEELAAGKADAHEAKR